MPKIKNIIIFIVIAIVIVFIFFYFTKASSADQANLVSSGSTATTNVTGSGTDGNSIAQSFLTLLLSVKTIKLDVSIFSDPAFSSLHDSSISLTPDAVTGKPNPFAQFGAAENALTSANAQTAASAQSVVPAGGPSAPADTTPNQSSSVNSDGTGQATTPPAPVVPATKTAPKTSKTSTKTSAFPALPSLNKSQ